jgi:hypothetical protein
MNYDDWLNFSRRPQSICFRIRHLQSGGAGIAGSARESCVGRSDCRQPGIPDGAEAQTNSATAIGDSLSSSSPSQLSTDLAALGSALSSGDLSTAQSAFAAVHSDLNKASSPSQTNEINAASQSAQLVHELLDSLNSSSPSSSSTSNGTTSVLETVYGSKRSLNVLA